MFNCLLTKHSLRVGRQNDWLSNALRTHLARVATGVCGADVAAGPAGCANSQTMADESRKFETNYKV